MATENAKVNTRIQLKHDTKGNWEKATNFIPKAGEIIIYDIDENNTSVRFKVGDGSTTVNNLPFTDLNTATKTELEELASSVAYIDATDNETIVDPDVSTSIFITPEMFGAKGDGITDDTEAINSALNCSGVISFSTKTYLVDASIFLNVKSNSVINLNWATIKVIPNNLPRHYAFNVENVENVVIQNGVVIGERDEHTGDEGEWGFGIRIQNSKNVSVRNVTIKDFWGDGICLGGVNKDIIIEKCQISNCRRQGISICGAENIIVANCYIANINGTDPQSCIDVEPNDGETAKNVLIIGNVFESPVSTCMKSCQKKDGTRIIENLIITKNTFIGTAEYAVYIIGHSAIIEGNIFHGVYSTDVLSFKRAEFCKVKNNYLSNCETGHIIYLENSPNIEIAENTINNTSCKYLLYNKGSSYLKFIANKIKEITALNSEVLIYLDGIADANILKSIIKDNIMSNIGFHGILRLSRYSTNTRFIDNIIEDSSSLTNIISQASSLGCTVYAYGNFLPALNTPFVGVNNGEFLGVANNNYFDNVLTT